MGDIFFTILFQPLYNALVGLYVLVPWGGVGVSIIILTAIVKFAVFPLTYKSLKSQKEMQEIQPKIEEIKVKYKDNQEQLAKWIADEKNAGETDEGLEGFFVRCNQLLRYVVHALTPGWLYV